MRTWIHIAAVCSLLLSAPAHGADDVAVAGRRILKKYKDAVVTVKVVMKQGMVYSGRDSNRQEVKNEVTGTVIDPSGLVLVSLTATDPSHMYNKIIGGWREDDSVRFESSVSDIKIMLSDGKEIPAKVALRDRDLDLAFIRPEEKLAKEIPSVDLGKAAAPEIMDQVVIVNRLGKIASRTPAVSAGRVAAVVSKPRTFYVLEQAGSTYGLGTPVFTLDGKIVGLVFLRSIKSQRNGFGGMFSGTGNMGVLPIVVPVDDILDSAQQVPPYED